MRLEKESLMAFKDILLTLTSYPDPTPVTVAEEAVSILGRHVQWIGRTPVRNATGETREIFSIVG